MVKVIKNNGWQVGIKDEGGKKMKCPNILLSTDTNH